MKSKLFERIYTKPKEHSGEKAPYFFLAFLSNIDLKNYVEISKFKILIDRY